MIQISSILNGAFPCKNSFEFDNEVNKELNWLNHIGCKILDIQFNFTNTNQNHINFPDLIIIKYDDEDASICLAEFSIATSNILIKNGIKTMGQLRKLDKEKIDDLKGIGGIRREEIEQFLPAASMLLP